MKLIFCDSCYDVFKLSFEERQCSCGKCWGMYEADGHRATTNGKGFALAINNYDLMDVLREFQKVDIDARYENFRRDYQVEMWVRPHSGPGNPRTRVK